MKLALILAFALVACDSATDSGADTRDMRGDWTYNGIQDSPRLSVTGTLRIDRQNGAEFSGAVNFSETDVQGTIRNRTGILSGQVLDANTIEFDIFIEETSRYHLGAVRADSMSGPWARSSVNPAITGSFSARKLP